jgi:hypothetical protein
MDALWARCPSCARWFECPESGLTDARGARCPDCSTRADLLWDRDDGLVLTAAQLSPHHPAVRMPRSLQTIG